MGLIFLRAPDRDEGLFQEEPPWKSRNSSWWLPAGSAGKVSGFWGAGWFNPISHHSGVCGGLLVSVVPNNAGIRV